MDSESFTLWEKAIIFFQGFIELLGVSLFLIGFFTDIQYITLLGGLLVTAVSIFEIIVGASFPLLPGFLSLVLGIVISPWYIGVFWALTGLSSLNTLNNIHKVLNPTFFLKRIHSRG